MFFTISERKTKIIKINVQPNKHSDLHWLVRSQIYSQYHYKMWVKQIKEKSKQFFIVAAVVSSKQLVLVSALVIKTKIMNIKHKKTGVILI